MRRRAELVVPFLALAALLGCGPKFDQQAWLRDARLGPFKDAEPLTEIERKARVEGKLVVWSQSSRLSATGRAFEKKYGIACVVQAMDAQDLIRKVRLDQESSGFNADVYLFGDAPEVLSTITRAGHVWPWVTPATEAEIPAPLRVGLPAHHVSAIGLVYNAAKYAEPPIKSWWDLTTPAWRGRVVMKDLTKGGGDINLVSTFIEHGDELEKDYRARFGEDLRLDGTKSAGYEFLKRLLANNPIFTASGSEASDQVGAANVANPPIGVMTLGKVRYKEERDLALKWMADVTPVPVVAFPEPIGVANGAKHPNAAKLFIEYAQSDEGYAPYSDYGTWPARTRAPVPEGMAPLAETPHWTVDAEFNFKVRTEVFDFIVEHE
ncbi:MAG: ABC transporter substrate-binding protein [Acidobacteriota bacterium]